MPAESRRLLALFSPSLLKTQFGQEVLDAVGYPAWRKERSPGLVGTQTIVVGFAARQIAGGLDRQSGSIFLPSDWQESDKPLSWVLFFKGTELLRDETPSNGKGLELPIIRLLASLGYAVFAPDYVGMAASMGIQEYCVPDSLANSGSDGLAAARAWLSKARRGGKDPLKESGRLYIVGYSEGGLSAMAAVQSIASKRLMAPGLELAAAWPMAAPLNLMSAVPFLTEEPAILRRPDYQVYIAMGWARAYPGIVNLSDILLPRTISEIVPLFDGKHSGDSICVSIARTVGKQIGKVTDKDLFTASFLQGLRADPLSLPYFLAQDKARLDRFIPPAGLHLVLMASETDEIVRFSNSEDEYLFVKRMAPSSSIELVRLSARDHGRGAVEGMLYAIVDMDRRERAR